MPLRPASEAYHPAAPYVLQDEPISDHYERWGYSIAYEVDGNGQPTPEGGNTAVFRIFPHGMTEPVAVTKPEYAATFTVNVLSGEGELIRAKSDGEVEVTPLSEDSEVTIRPGEAYVYRNTDADSDLVLHDIALPAFQPGDDMELTSSLLTRSSSRFTKHGRLKACTVAIPDGGHRTVYLPKKFFDLVGKATAGK